MGKGAISIPRSDHDRPLFILVFKGWHFKTQRIIGLPIKVYIFGRVRLIATR